MDIVTGVDPSKFSGGTGRIGEEVLRRGLGFGADGRPVLASSGGRPGETVSVSQLIKHQVSTGNTLNPPFLSSRCSAVKERKRQ